jgi:large subunit ribosomal protein L1
MKTRTLVFATVPLMTQTRIDNKGDVAEEAIKHGADIVGGEELLPQIERGELAFDRLITTPDMAKKLMPLARVLGPRGLMPTVKKGVCL